MPATSKKQVIAIMLPNANVTATSCNKNAGGALTKTAQTVGASTLTTPAALAGVFNATSFLGVASNIESVSNIVTNGTNRLIIARLVAMPLTDTLAFSVTTSAAYTGQVVDVSAFVDAGLSSDAEMAALSTFMSALNTALV